MTSPEWIAGAAKRHWVKLHERWLETTSHADLSFDALAGGALLMLLACKHGWDEIGAAWIVNDHGRALTVEQIGRRLRCTTKRTQAILSELSGAGTMAKRDDGAWGFPRARRHQAHPSAERMQRHRARHNGVTVTDDVTRVTRNVVTEAEAEAEELTRSPSGHGVTPRRKSRTKPDVPPLLRADAEALWDEQERLRAAVPGLRRLDRTDERLARICALLAAGRSPDDCRHVLAVYQAQALADPEARRWFNGDTNWRRSNFERALGQPVASSDAPAQFTDEELHGL